MSSLHMHYICVVFPLSYNVYVEEYSVFMLAIDTHSFQQYCYSHTTLTLHAYL